MGSTAIDEFGTTVVVNLSLEDVLRIGELGSLARDVNSTFLRMYAYTIDDTFGRDVVAITDTKARQATRHIPDTSPPIVIAANLNMSDGNLELVFNEAVNVSTFQITEATLIASESGLSENRTFTGGVVDFAENKRSCVISLSDEDLDFIKISEQLAVSKNSTHLLHSSEFISDYFGNKITGVTQQSNAIDATSFVEDLVRPRLVSFGLNMDVGTISLSFDEAINASSVRVDQFGFHASGVDSDSSAP